VSDGRTPAGRDHPADDAVLLDDERAARLLPVRSARSHKGTHGRVVIVAGSLDHLGAALLATHAATRAGSGLVCLAVPASLQPLVAGRVAEAVTMSLPETAPGEVDPVPAAARLLERPADALLVGPGLMAGDASAELVRRLLTADPRPGGPADGLVMAPAIVDAEGLNILATSGRWWKRVRRRCVLTPHPGEFARLDGDAVGDDDAERATRAAAAARRWDQTVVLKGARTVIADADGQTSWAPFENPALATAGTGDVLAGTMAWLARRGGASLPA
jgi:ADP-dependent NAD(P)H-hydrate dehydratase / NAD(P)H-hydrate epimerase